MTSEVADELAPGPELRPFALPGRGAHGETHYYRSPSHDRMVLPADGIMQVDDPGDSAVRH